MKLKETIDIRYKSIIDHGHLEKVTEHYEGKAIHEVTFSEESYSFQHQTYGHMQVQIKDGKVYLKYGGTQMEMVYEKRHRILYKTLYGPLELEVYLKKMTRTNNSLHLVYYLYDNNTLLSKCYLMIDKINLILS